MSKKETHSNQITNVDSKNFCLSEILDQNSYQILRDCEIYTLNDLWSCDVTKHPYDEQIVIDRVQNLTEGNKLQALMSIRARRTSENSGKVLNGNASAMNDNLTPRCGDSRYESISQTNRWGPRLSYPRQWGPRLGSTNGYKRHDNHDYDRDQPPARKPSDHYKDITTIAQAQADKEDCKKHARKLSGDCSCSTEEAFTESLAQKLKSGDSDAMKRATSPAKSRSFNDSKANILFSSDESVDSSFASCLDGKAKISVYDEVMTPHHTLHAKKRENTTVTTIDILFSSDGEAGDSFLTNHRDGQENLSSCNEIIKLPNNDASEDSAKYFSMSMSDSSIDSSQSQQVTRLGSSTNQICLTSDDEHSSSTISPPVRANGRSFTNSSGYLDNKQRNNTTHYTNTLEKEPSPSTANDSTSSMTVSPIPVAISSPVQEEQISSNNSMLSGSISISQIKNGCHGSISPLRTNCKKKNSRLSNDISSPSCLSINTLNRPMQSSNGTQSSSSSSVSILPKVRNTAPSYDILSSSSSSVSAILQNRIAEPLNEVHSLSSSSISTITRNRKTQQSNEVLSVSSSPLSFSSFSACPKSRSIQPLNETLSLSSSSLPTLPKSRNIQSLNETQSLSSSPPKGPAVHRNNQPSNKIQSLSASPIPALLQQVTQPSTEIQRSSCISDSAPRNENNLPQNNTQTSLINIKPKPLNEILNPSSSPGDLESTSRCTHPLISNFSGKCVGLITDFHRRNRGIENALIQKDDYKSDTISAKSPLAPKFTHSSSPKLLDGSSSPPKGSAVHRNNEPSQKIQSLSASPIPALLQQVTQPSTEIQRSSCISDSAPRNENNLQQNNIHTSPINTKSKPLNEILNPSSSSVDLESTSRCTHPLISNFSGKCVGSIIDLDTTFAKRDSVLDLASDSKVSESVVVTPLIQKKTDRVRPRNNTTPTTDTISHTVPLANEKKRTKTQVAVSIANSAKKIHSNQITSTDTKSLCLSEIFDEKCYQILRDCEIYTLNDLRSCNATEYHNAEKTVIDRAQTLIEGNKLNALMSIRRRRMSKNDRKSRVVLNGKSNHSDLISQLGNQGTDRSRNESFDSTSIEFFKSEGIVTRENLLNFTVKDLRRKYDAWCTHYLHDQTKSSPLIVAKWQLIARSYESGYILEQSRKRRRKFSAISNRYNRNETSILQGEASNKHRRISDANKLNLIDIVDSKTHRIAENGRPVLLITAMNHETETLYDFQLHTGESHIPNSGFGAFLTFEGARLLKPEAAKRSKQIIKDRYPVDVPSARLLEAKGIDGMNVSVSLKGDNLHGNGNNPYFRVTRFPLKAILQNGKKVQVTIGPESIHEDIDLLRKNNEIPFHTDGFGHFKMVTKDDYAESEEDFCSHSDGCGLIDIGRYGPFLPSDRKTVLEFNMKDFLFDFEPAGWNFGVSEKLKGSEQVIDITSDSTGETHNIAQAHIPMYVNEVGHNKDLCQNILSREKDNRIVNYYLYIQQPMKKGHTVELLTHYGDKYEETRERKGYGKANIECGLKDSSDDNARMRHNISSRKSVEATIKSMSLEEVEQTIHFLLNKIFIPLTIRIEWFAEKYFKLIRKKRRRNNFVEQHQLSTRQWRAWRRLSWLGAMLQSRVDVLMIQSEQHDSIPIINDGVRRMKWTTNKLLLDMLQKIKGKSGETMLDEIHSEIFEENLFLVSKSNDLIHTFDSSLWCATARKLVRDVAGKTIATYKLEDPLAVTEHRLKSLATDLVELAADAVSNIREACIKLRSSNTTGVPCYFDSAVQSLYFDKIRDEQHQEKLVYAYQDALELGCMEECVNMGDSNFPWNISSKFLRTLNSKTCDDIDLVSCDNFNEVLCDFRSPQSGAAQVDENWYALWQVVRVIHCFATKCIEWSIGGKDNSVSIYSLERLCKRVGVNVKDARKMLSQEMVHRTKPPIIKRNKPEVSTIARMNCTVKDHSIKRNKSSPHFDESNRTLSETIAKMKYTVKDHSTKPKTNDPYSDKSNGTLPQIPSICRTNMDGSLYDESDGTLPEGWRLEHVKRPNSKHVDRYWYTIGGKKLRSRIEVALFLKCLELSNNNESEALELYLAEIARLKIERMERTRLKKKMRCSGY